MHNISFLGKREDKNTVEQLKKQGDALTLNNQRNITTAIDKLSEDSSEENIKFLMNVAQGLRYGTSFELDGKKTNNDWKGKLQSATEKALAKTDSPNKAKLQEQFKATFIDKKEMSEDEKSIMALRSNILKTKGLPQAINDSKIDVVKNIAKNLDYFVISSEITTKEKKSCLEKLNKFMSDDYKINPQLKNKKPQVLGELLNDLVVKTAESDKPTIKTTDQRHHGMCAAISTSRKVMAYEYKDKYVTMIMEELNNKPEMKVYDPTKLGTNAKISVPKTEVDFDYADDKGYRILDASALQWMNIAGNSGRGDIQSTKFSAFDRQFFDTFHDAHYMRELDDPKLVPHQYHLRALEKADEFLTSAKKGIEKREKEAVEQKQNEKFNAQTVVKANAALNKELSALMPEKNQEEMNKVVNRFLKMGEVKGTQSDDLHFFDYEEEVMKKQKMANFIKKENPNVKQEDIDAKMNDIYNMYELSTETTEYMNKEIIPKSPANKMKKLYKPLFEAAGAYRTAQDKKLDIPENLAQEVKKYDLKPDATKADVMKKYEKEGKVVPENILRSMQDKYNKIAKYAAVVEKAEVKGEKLDMPNLYEMTDAEKEALDKVAKNLNKMQAEISRETKAKQKELEQPLNALAKEIGKEQGNFWVHKEGSSGLCTPQEIRILEQMTGKPYYAEESVEAAAERIKKGQHSGISGTSVYHNDHGGHAQYIADVAPLLVKDPKTGKVEIKDAIMHDNTWGEAEHKKTWLDSRGLLRTDYQCGRGGKDGYITNSAWQNGTLVEDYKYEPGSINGNKFKMFYDAILPTVENDTTNTSVSLVQNAFIGPDLNKAKVAQVLQAVKKVPVEFLDKVMERAENAGETKKSIELQVMTDLDNIHSEADLSKSHKRTQNYMNSVAEQLSFTRDNALNAISEAAQLDVTAKDIDKIEDKSFQVMKHFIDEKFDPKDNKAFITKFNEIKAMDENGLKSLIESSTDEQLGVKTVTPYDAARQIKGLEPAATNALNSLMFMDSIQDNIKLTEKGDSFEEAYFILQRDWNNLNASKEIRQLKNKMYAQHGVRAAYPECSLTTKEETAELAKDFSETLKDGIKVVNDLKQMKDGKIDKQGLTDKEIDIAMKNQLADIAEGKKAFIEANIEPQHRHAVAGALNNYLSDAIKGKNTDESYAKFEKSFDRYHILNNPQELLKEFVRLAKNKNPDNKQLLKTYEGYMIKGCQELAKFDAAVTMMSEASNGHMHEIAKDFADITTPKEWDELGEEHNLGTDEGFYAFLEKSQETCGVDNTLTMLNHIGQNDRAMRLEMENINVLNELKTLLSSKTIPQIMDYAKTKANFVNGLNLSKSPKEAKMREEYMAKMNEFIEYINKTSPTLVTQAK
ncbi:hypothetical protein IKE67_08475 [bacterium]|nr:hypothetical protein [bacterium]